MTQVDLSFDINQLFVGSSDEEANAIIDKTIMKIEQGLNRRPDMKIRIARKIVEPCIKIQKIDDNHSIVEFTIGFVLRGSKKRNEVKNYINSILQRPWTESELNGGEIL